MSLRTLAQRRSRSASERVGGCLGGFGMALHYHRPSSRQGGRMPDSVFPFDGARPTRWRLTMICNWRLLLAAALLACCGAAGPAHAQSYPSRPITIVVPYPAGGVTDNLVRLLAERMKNSLGQSIVVENIGGAAGTIGVDRSRTRRRTVTRWCWVTARPWYSSPIARQFQSTTPSPTWSRWRYLPSYPVPLGDDQRRAGQEPPKA